MASIHMTQRTIFAPGNMALHGSAGRSPEGPCIIAPFVLPDRKIMEAEHINSISYKLDDLAQRAAELRRYL
jgi:hypothetical protein